MGRTRGEGSSRRLYHQFRTDSRFNHHLNLGDETPGDIHYTSVFAHTDELVQPSGLNGPATAALADVDPALCSLPDQYRPDWGGGGPAAGTDRLVGGTRP